VDAIAVSVSLTGGPSYSRVRLAGHAGFLGCVLGLGLVGDALPPGFGFLLCAASDLALGVGWLVLRRWAPAALPLDRPPPGPPSLARTGGRPSRARLVRLVLGWTAFGMAAGVQTSTISLHLVSLGASSALVGLAWALGQAAELAVFAIA